MEKERGIRIVGTGNADKRAAIEFIKQIKNLEVFTVTTPRTYITWTNTEIGRDVTETYERVNDVSVVYINIYNKSTIITKGDDFFDKLELIYKRALKEA